jgi:hypothetical protein
MNMKKLIAVFISLFACCLLLASCEKPVGYYLDGYDYVAPTVYKVEYDLYIICEEGTVDTEMARTTVSEKINQVFGDKYNTRLNIIFYTPDDIAVNKDTDPDNDMDIYEAYETQLKVDLGIAEVEGFEKKTVKPAAGYNYGGRIVLIQGYDMIVDSGRRTELGKKLINLAPYLDTTDFGTLNTQINAPLLAAADVFETKDADGNDIDPQLFGKLAIPNNRVYGEYKYVCINRAIAESVLNFSALTEIPAMKTAEDINELLDAYAIYLYGEGKTHADLTEDDVKSIVKEVSGPYELKGLIESGEHPEYKKGVASEWMCNVITYPTATAEEAYKYAYGIIPENNLIVDNSVAVDYAYRAMQIVYSFHNDAEMVNLICYGVPNTNYRLVDGVVEPITAQPQSIYKMKHEYCGDVFKAHFSKDEKYWTKEMAENGKNQVKEAVLSED